MISGVQINGYNVPRTNKTRFYMFEVCQITILYHREYSTYSNICSVSHSSQKIVDNNVDMDVRNFNNNVFFQEKHPSACVSLLQSCGCPVKSSVMCDEHDNAE